MGVIVMKWQISEAVQGHACKKRQPPHPFEPPGDEGGKPDQGKRIEYVEEDLPTGKEVVPFPDDLLRPLQDDLFIGIEGEQRKVRQEQTRDNRSPSRLPSTPPEEKDVDRDMGRRIHDRAGVFSIQG